jgi:hypothetical protein
LLSQAVESVPEALSIFDVARIELDEISLDQRLHFAPCEELDLAWIGKIG